MKNDQTKLAQALSLLSRQRLRTRSLANTVRDMAMLLSENTEMIHERNEMVGHPLGFVHGHIGRIRELIGPEVELRMYTTANSMTCIVITPNGSQQFSFSDADYDSNIDMLAASIRGVCEQRGLIAKGKE